MTLSGQQSQIKTWFLSLVSMVVVLVSVNLVAVFALGDQFKRLFWKIQYYTIGEMMLFYGSWIVWSTARSALQRTRKLWCKRASLTLLAMFLLISNSSIVTIYLLPGKNPHWYTTFSFICLGIFANLIAAIFVLKMIFLAIRGIARIGFIKLHQRKASGSTPYGTADFIPSRLGRLSLILIFIYSVSIGLYGVSQAWKPPVVITEELTLPKFPKSLDGLQILMLSDIHLGTNGFDQVALLVDMVKDIQPDVTVLVGDLVEESVTHLRESAEPLKKLADYSTRGTYFVTGNHEYYSFDVDNWFNFLKQIGITVLHNASIKLKSKDQSEYFCLAGVDDIESSRMKLFEGHGMDLEKALSDCNDQHTTVLLAHQPKAAKEALDANYDIQLVLSGHTHGGQFFPASILIYLLNPFYAGLYEYNGAFVYVSQGAFYWGVPMRIGSRTEVNLITLRSP